MLVLADGLAGEADAEFLEDFAVDFAGHHGGVNLAAVEHGQAVEGAAAVVVKEAQYRQGDQHLVGVQARVAAVQHANFGVLDGFNHFLRDELDAVVDAGQMLQCVEQQGGAGTEQVAGGGGDDGAVGQFDSCRRSIFLIATLLGGHGGATVVGGDFGLLHEQGNLVNLVLGGLAVGVVAKGGIVAADNLVFRCLAASFVVADAEARHVDTHVGGRLVGVLSIDAFKQSI